MPCTAKPKTVEYRVRRKAARNGYGVTKSRRYVDGWDNQASTCCSMRAKTLCVLGSSYDATLDEIEDVARSA